MARKHRDKEKSIYDCSGETPAVGYAAAPKVKTYDVRAPAGPKIRMHEDSSQVESLLNPIRGIRDAQMRAGITPTNHSRHNILAIKEQSRLNALQKLQLQDGAHATSQQQFTSQLRRTMSGAPSGSGTSRSLSGGGRQPAIVRSVSSVGATAGRWGSSSGGGNASNSGSGRNFLKENRAAAAAASRPVKAESRQDDGSAYLQKSEYGQVPAYLLQRKMDLVQQEEAMLAAKQAAQIPAGLRQMPEAERLTTLQLLEANRAEVEAKIATLPIIMETPSMIRHKDELERRLREIEDAQKIFSRPNVLVHATQQSL